MWISRLDKHTAFPARLVSVLFYLIQTEIQSIIRHTRTSTCRVACTLDFIQYEWVDLLYHRSLNRLIHIYRTNKPHSLIHQPLGERGAFTYTRAHNIYTQTNTHSHLSIDSLTHSLRSCKKHTLKNYNLFCKLDCNYAFGSVKNAPLSDCYSYSQQMIIVVIIVVNDMYKNLRASAQGFQ